MIGRAQGTIIALRGGLLEAELSFVRCGDAVSIRSRGSSVGARVIALHGARVILAPWSGVDGVACGDLVTAEPAAAFASLGTVLLGRAVDARGLPLDGRAPVRSGRVAVAAPTPALGERRAIGDLFVTGVRAIDGLLGFGRGARIGVFGPAGAGKSSLLDAIVHGCDADAVVIGLIGERGREAERHVRSLDARTTVVCATGERPPAERVRAAEFAFAQAATLRARGLDVLLVLDSLARFAGAAREIGLAAGEPPGRGGFPVSVFAAMARLLESAGPTVRGSVTLVATILSDGPDEHDPISEAARAALDGHLVLRETLARRGHFPAIDIVASTSRTFADCATAAHREAAGLIRAAVAALDESRDARGLGIDAAASDPLLARAVAHEPALAAFLRQAETPSPLASTLGELTALAEALR